MKLFKNKIIKKKKDRMLSCKQIKNSKAKLYNTQKNTCSEWFPHAASSFFQNT